MDLKTFWYTIFYGLAVYCCSTQSTLSKSNKQKTEQVKETNDEAFDESGSVLQEEVERYEYEPLSHSAKMPVDDEQRTEILERHSKLDISSRGQNFVTLGYVTIWNNYGYDIAKWTAKKFTHISPVWFQLRSARNGDQIFCDIGGTHDIDRGWMDDILKNNSEAKIVPRILLEGWGEELKLLLTDQSLQIGCIRNVIDLLKKNGMDGCSLEIWLQVMAATRGSAAAHLVNFLELFGEEFRQAGLLFILPITAPLDHNNRELGIVPTELIGRLVRAVDFINLMTYDFPSPEISGVAPINWIEANIRYILGSGDDIDPKKILLGINFYGYDRTGGSRDAILGKKFIELLSKPNSILVFDESSSENRVEYGQNGVAYFPTKRSLSIRFDLVKFMDLGGIAIWELGQGLDYFTYLL